MSNKSMNVSTTSFRCSVYEESIFHALLGCKEMKQIWKTSGFYNVIDPSRENDVIGFGFFEGCKSFNLS